MFIQDQDFDATVHRDILLALTREDEALPNICVDRAVAEARSYLCSGYDCDALFGASGRERHPLILMMVLDIAVYHLFCIHNPQKISQMRKDRYDRAVAWLKAVNRQEITIEGAPRLGARKSERFYFHSNKKRVNHW